MQSGGGACSLDDDMLEGDLGNGTRVRSGLRSGRIKSQSFSGPSETSQTTTDRPRTDWQAGEKTWISGLRSTESLQKARCRLQLTGSRTDLSNDELRDSLKDANQLIDLLFSELEVTHRYLEGKYKALKILQGKAILDKATCHTKSVLQKSEEKAKALEREVNSLQWEIGFSQVQMRKSQQSWEHQYSRVLRENKTLSDSLQQRENEIQQLRAENSALSRQGLELLSLLSIKEQKLYQDTKPQYGSDRDAGILELAVLGACRCVGGGEVCPCSRTAAASRKQLVQLQHELDAQCSRREEAMMVADAFRIAFEQQLRKRSEQFLLMAEANILKSHHCRPEGSSRSPLLSVRQRLKGLLPSGMEVKMSDDLLETLYRLLDLLNDKEEALAHQRKVSLMLAHNAEELQRQLQLDLQRQTSEPLRTGILSDSRIPPSEPRIPSEFRIQSKKPGKTGTQSTHKNLKSKSQPSDLIESTILSRPSEESLINQSPESEIPIKVSLTSSVCAQADPGIPESQVLPGQPQSPPESRAEPQELSVQIQSPIESFPNHMNLDSVPQQPNPYPLKSKQPHGLLGSQDQLATSEPKIEQVPTESNSHLESRFPPDLSDFRTDPCQPQTKSEIKPVSAESCNQSQSNHKDHRSEIPGSDSSRSRTPSDQPQRTSGIQGQTDTTQPKIQSKSESSILQQQQRGLPESQVQSGPTTSQSEFRNEPQELIDLPQTPNNKDSNHKELDTGIQQLNLLSETQEPLRKQNKSRSKINQVPAQSNNLPLSNHKNYKSEIPGSESSRSRIPTRQPQRPSRTQGQTVSPESDIKVISECNILQKQDLLESWVRSGQPTSLPESRTESDPPQTNLQLISNHKRHKSDPSESRIPLRQPQGLMKKQIQIHQTLDSPESRAHLQDPTKSVFRVQHPNTATTRPSRVPASVKTTSKSVRVQD